MPQTRAQAKATAAKEAREREDDANRQQQQSLAEDEMTDMELTTTIIHEDDMDDALVTYGDAYEVGNQSEGTPFRVQLGPSCEQEIMGIANRFWNQTEAAEVRRANFEMQHARLAAAQNAALMQLKNSTQLGVEQLAEHQNLTANQFRDELNATRAAMQTHLMELAQMQAEQGQQIHQSLEQQIRHVFEDSQAQATNVSKLLLLK